MTTAVIKTTFPTVDWETTARACRGALRLLKAEFEVALEKDTSIDQFRNELRDSIRLIDDLGVT